jgi:uncharacterized protein
MWELLLPLFGFLIVIVASMTGVGGGIIFVPLLTLAYGFSPAHAVGTSLMVIIFGGLSATVGFTVQKRVYFKTGVLLALATVPGSVVGAFLTTILQGAVLGLLFGVFLVVVAVRMVAANSIFRGRKLQQDNVKAVRCESDLFLNWKRLAAGTGLAFFGGLVSGLLGVGGGILLVPIMALVLLMPMHAVVATSMFAMIFTSLSGVTQHWTLGNVNLEYGLLLALGALAGAQVGAWLCKRVSAEKLRLIFGILVFVVSIQMIVKYI